MQILDLLGRESQSFLLVVFLQILHMLDGFRLDVDGEDVLVEPFVHALQHGVVLGLLVVDGKILFYTRNAAKIHVLRNLNGICRPRCHHLTARAYEESLELLSLAKCGTAVEPAQFVDFLFVELMIHLGGNHALLWGLEEKNHVSLYLN